MEHTQAWKLIRSWLRLKKRACISHILLHRNYACRCIPWFSLHSHVLACCFDSRASHKLLPPSLLRVSKAERQHHCSFVFALRSMPCFKNRLLDERSRQRRVCQGGGKGDGAETPGRRRQAGRAGQRARRNLARTLGRSAQRRANERRERRKLGNSE